MITREIESTPRQVCIIGIGNKFRNDDGIGLLVAEWLKESSNPGVQVVALAGEGGDLLGAWSDTDTVFLIDAVSSGSPGGTIHRIDVNHQLIPTELFHHSTHAFSVANCIELAKILGTLPERCILFGIEGKDYRMGTTISPAVKKAANEVVTTIQSEISSLISLPVHGARSKLT
jgi:hydrogenase maturation protease